MDNLKQPLPLKPVWEVDANGNIIEHYLWDNDQVQSAIGQGRHIIETGWDTPHSTPKYDFSTNTWVEGADPSFLLDRSKKDKKMELEAMMERAVANGFPSSADGTARTYALDSASMQKWTGAMTIANAGKMTANLGVKDFNGKRVSLTPPQFQQMASDGFTFFNQMEQKLWDLHDQVDACTDVPSVKAITWE